MTEPEYIVVFKNLSSAMRTFGITYSTALSAIGALAEELAKYPPIVEIPLHRRLLHFLKKGNLGPRWEFGSTTDD